MRKKRQKLIIAALGGALTISALFVYPQFAESYDSQNTHPALTNATVDFYNLNFPDNPLSQNDKQMLIKGSTDEDNPPRWFNHFYDPVHNQGWAGYTTSKQWAQSSGLQIAFHESNFAGFAAFFRSNISDYDYSYQRALYDYATGDRERAMLAMGHVMHLLEDANVPAHTRGDTHLPWAGTESPYEKEMAKWTPSSFNIAEKLKKGGAKPILRADINEYFDEIARYSNGYFFSQDTINSDKYNSPKIRETRKYIINGKERLFAIYRDRDGSIFKLTLLNFEVRRNIVQIQDHTLVNPEIGPLILNDYWSRLSKDFVLHGAGALKLFLDQAELVRKEYLARNPKSPRSGGLLGLLSSGNNGNKVPFDPELINDIISNDDTQLSTGSNDDVFNIVSMMTPLPVNEPTPSPSGPIPMLPLITPSPLIAPLPTDKPTPSPSPTPVDNWGGVGGGSGNSSASTPTPSPTPSPTDEPTPTPSLTPTPSPTPSLTPTPSPTPTPTPSPSPSPTPEPENDDGDGGDDDGEELQMQVVINEIAWMGTGASTNDEWIELFNPQETAVDISGWTLTAGDGLPQILLSSISIDPLGYLLLERTDDDTVSDVTADIIYTGALNNDGERLELRDKDDVLQDVVDCSTGWYAGNNGDKSSMERKDPSSSGSESNNWATNNGTKKGGNDAAGNPINGTPRTKNSVAPNEKPAVITDLTVDPESGYGQPILYWTAPGDDDNQSNDLGYEIRYGGKEFETEDDWSVAAAIPQENTPQVSDPGDDEEASVDISGYGSDKDAYFAVRTFDGADWSDISNSAKYTLKPQFSGIFKGPANPTVRWEFAVPDALYTSQLVISPENAVYFGAPDNLNGFNRFMALNDEGGLVWENPYNALPSRPAVSGDGSVQFGFFDPGARIIALNPNGSERWDYNVGDRVNSVAVDKIGGETSFASENGLMTILNADGSQKWQIFNSFAFGFTPVHAAGDIFTATNNNGLPEYYRYNGSDGAEVWKNRVTDTTPYSGSDVTIDENAGKLYAVSTDYGFLFTIDTSSGEIIKKVFDYSARPTTKISVAGDLLVLAADFSYINPASGSLVFGLNKGDKSVAWTFPVASPVLKEISVDAGNNLYFGTKSGLIYSLDTAGQERWVVDLDGTTEVFPILGEGAVFSSVGGKVIKLSDGD